MWGRNYLNFMYNRVNIFLVIKILNSILFKPVCIPLIKFLYFIVFCFKG